MIGEFARIEVLVFGRFSRWLAGIWLICFMGVAGAAPGGDFTLTRTDGSEFSLESVRGQVVVIAFGYTSCPDVCPTTLVTISSLMKALGPRAQEVVPLFISVDPHRDTAEKLRTYLDYFHPKIIGLSGKVEKLRQVVERYNTFFRYQGDTESGSYVVDHSSGIYIVDRDGTLVRIVPYGMPTSQVVDSVRDVLGEPPAQPTARGSAAD